MSRVQDDLFADPVTPGVWLDLALPDASVRLLPGAFPVAHSRRLLAHLQANTPWRQPELTIAGRTLPIPRLQCWMGDPDMLYGYSGMRLEPVPWSPVMQEVRQRVQALCGQEFNSVLMNLYRDGRDSVAWHADDERELGPAPVIASVSLGAERPFQLKHRRRKELRHRISLPDGSLLLMAGPTQSHWLHQLPKVRGLDEARMNLTFRLLQTPTAA